MIIMKFGGTSMGSPERMHHVSKLITQTKEKKIVVLSAVSGTTNTLVDIATLLEKGNKKLAIKQVVQLENGYIQFVENLLHTHLGKIKGHKVIKEHFNFLKIINKISYNDSLNKDILAQGELLSTKLFSIYLEEEKINHSLIPALHFMKLNSREEPDYDFIKEKIQEEIANSKNPQLLITQGYICRNTKGEIDNLKRGGSDYTATIIAAVLKAKVCEIWTDIDGMHNNDPRVVKQTRPIEELSFEEAAELAYYGAKILHPTCILPVQKANVSVKLLNTLQPEAKGTIIQQKVIETGPKAIAAKDNITLINIVSMRMFLAYGFVREVFAIFEKYKTSVDMITTSEVAISVSIDQTHSLKGIIEELSEFAIVTVKHNQCIVSIVGNEITTDKKVFKKIFDSLLNIDMAMVSYGGSPHNISLLINADDKKLVLQKLNKALFNLE